MYNPTSSGQAIEDFRNMDPWRIFRIMAEFVEGFESMANVHNGVCVFGSARTPQEHPYYKMAVEVGRRLAEDGYSVITGGGPGIMEAANRGAAMARGTSVGLNIDLPFEQKHNPYINRLLNFRYFFCRKVMFSKYSRVIITFPGGYGTLDELFEHLTLVQTHKIPPLPIIMVGKAFWSGCFEWVKRAMLEENPYISAKDLELHHIVDTPEEVIALVREKFPLIPGGHADVEPKA